MCEAKGIKLETSVAHQQWQNGSAERVGGILMKGGRALMYGGNLPTRDWLRCVKNQSYIRNRMSNQKCIASGEGDTPFEQWEQQRFELSDLIDHFRVVGCLCYVIRPKNIRKKGDKLAYRAVFLGYADEDDIHQKAYIVRSLETGKTWTVAYNQVRFFEHHFPYPKESEDILITNNSSEFRQKIVRKNKHEQHNNEQEHSSDDDYDDQEPSEHSELSEYEDQDDLLTGESVLFDESINPDHMLEEAQEDITQLGKKLEYSNGRRKLRNQSNGQSNRYPQKHHQFKQSNVHATPDDDELLTHALERSGTSQSRICDNNHATKKKVTFSTEEEECAESVDLKNLYDESQTHVHDGDSPEISNCEDSTNESHNESLNKSKYATSRKASDDDSLSDEELFHVVRIEDLARAGPKRNGELLFLTGWNNGDKTWEPLESFLPHSAETLLKFLNNLSVHQRSVFKTRKQYRDLVNRISKIQTDVMAVEFSEETKMNMKKRIDETFQVLKAVVQKEEECLEDPQSLYEAQRCSDWGEFYNACKEEYDFFNDNKVWTLVPRPKGKNVVKVRWVFVRKRKDGKVVRWRSRLVCKGFTQKSGVDYDPSELYAPTMRSKSMNVLLVLAVQFNMKILQYDISKAFCHADCEEEVYIEQPAPFKIKGKEDYVYRLNKHIYGLKTSPSAYSKHMAKCMRAIGMKPADSDECLWVMKDDDKITYVLYHVDDILMTSNDEGMRKMVFERLRDDQKLLIREEGV